MRISFGVSSRWSLAYRAVIDRYCIVAFPPSQISPRKTGYIVAFPPENWLYSSLSPGEILLYSQISPFL